MVHIGRGLVAVVLFAVLVLGCQPRQQQGSAAGQDAGAQMQQGVGGSGETGAQAKDGGEAKPGEAKPGTGGSGTGGAGGAPGQDWDQ